VNYIGKVSDAKELNPFDGNQKIDEEWSIKSINKTTETQRS
jgi:hypothetical protein